MVVVAGAVVQLTLTLGLIAWGYAVARRRRGRWWLAMWMPAAAAMLSGLGIVALVVLASQHAARLSIAEVGCLFAPVALLYVASFVAFTAGSLARAHRPGAER